MYLRKNYKHTDKETDKQIQRQTPYTHHVDSTLKRRGVFVGKQIDKHNQAGRQVDRQIGRTVDK